MPTLEWANREAAVRAATCAPFRLLEHDPALSFGEPDNEKMLIHGDNLEGASALVLALPRQFDATRLFWHHVASFRDARTPDWPVAKKACRVELCGDDERSACLCR